MRTRASQREKTHARFDANQSVLTSADPIDGCMPDGIRRRAPENRVICSGTGLCTVKQAAVDLAVSVHTIRAWIARRKIAHVRLGRAIRIPATEITRLIARGTVPVLEDSPRRL